MSAHAAALQSHTCLVGMLPMQSAWIRCTGRLATVGCVSAVHFWHMCDLAYACLLQATAGELPCADCVHSNASVTTCKGCVYSA